MAFVLAFVGNIEAGVYGSFDNLVCCLRYMDIWEEGVIFFFSKK